MLKFIHIEIIIIIWSVGFSCLPSKSEFQKTNHSIANSQLKTTTNECNKRIVGYYPSWNVKKLSVTQASMFTNIIFAFAEMKSNGQVVISEIDRLMDVLDVRKNSGVKVSFSVGGWSNSQYFSQMANTSSLLNTFVKSVKQLMVEYDFDGVDLDWEYPVTGGLTQGIEQDRENLIVLLKKLRISIGADKILTIAGPAGYWVLDVAFDLPAIIDIVDWINVMAYDYFGPWGSKRNALIGPNSPLFHAAAKDFSAKLNVDYTLKYYSCFGKKPDKLVMGIGFYGRLWEKVYINTSDGLYQVGNGQLKSSIVSYEDILSLSENTLKSYDYFYDEPTQTPYLYDQKAKSLISFDDMKSIRAKLDYAKSKNIGGIMVWTIDDDDGFLSLTNEVNQYCQTKTNSQVNYECSPLKQGQRCWWTPDDSQPGNNGKCGKDAPLYNGHMPKCDPDDLSYNCCSKWGFCGSGSEYCDCAECVNYSINLTLLAPC